MGLELDTHKLCVCTGFWVPGFWGSVVSDKACLVSTIWVLGFGAPF